MTDPAGQVYAFDYDLQGNVIGAENPLGHQVKLSYEATFGQITLLEDARGNRSTFDYDDSGNLTVLTYPDGGQETITYSAAGIPTSHTSRSSDTIIYTHNDRGQLLRKDYPDGSWVAYSYDTAGNMTSASDVNGAITMEYDPDTDLLTRITYPSGHYFEFSYNDAWQRTQRLDQDSHELNYEYDAAGRPSRLCDENGAVIVSYEYDEVGRLSRESKGNGTYTTYEYDAAGQVISMVNFAPDDSVQSRFDYAYDANGNRTSMTTLAGTTTYNYDLIGQLVGVTYPGGRHVVYDYDAAGNRITVTDDGVPTDYTTNELNQYTQVGDATYTYDLNGNMTSRTDASGTTTYEYNYDNRLIRVTTPMSGTWEYAYDPLGNRIGVSQDGTSTRYVYDPIGLVDVAAEYDGSGALVARYVHGLGLVARIDATGTAAYYAYDATGHTRQLSNDTGAVANIYDYAPFGVSLQADEIIPNPFRYVGRFGVMDENNGLKYMYARYYDEGLGRFSSEDPLRRPGTNTYAYVLNSPLSLVDPRGQEGFLSELGKSISNLGFGRCFGISRDCSGLSPQEVRTLDPIQKAAWRHDVALHKSGHRLWELQRPSVLSAHWHLLNDLRPASLVASLIGQAVSSENITPDDPNEKTGPTGIGKQHLVGTDDELHYVIYFENKEEAGAPAQEVFVTDNLDSDLDWSTFHLTEIAWGDYIIAVPENTAGFYTRQTVEDYRTAAGKSWWVDVEVELNYVSGQVQWTFRTLDPQTEGLPLDPLAGFLPPNDETGRGEGHVAFTIQPRAEAAERTVLTNQASIVFDTNEPIVTNEVRNVIGEPKVYLPLVLRQG